ncbi:lactococcin 972 family bacteriocin [Streptomonospora algeriensis]|uniref:Lactococcin 972 family bacteriocin n=1 Tax=Streptomonospora algeriensis TaxID=995084 RepID=A0ABW3B9M7_9ACTN
MRESADRGDWSEAAAVRAVGNNQTYWRKTC